MDFTKLRRGLRRTGATSRRWSLGAQSAWWQGGVRPFCGRAGACFESVAVSGAEAVQAARMGAYTKAANLMQGERPVYKLAGSAVMYPFYWPNTTEWRIGSSYTSSSAGVKSSGNAGAACPDQATGWQAYTGGAWVGTYPITVVPTAVGKPLRPV